MTNDERFEINTGDCILVLDGNVLEAFFHDADLAKRWHVCHVAVDVKPHRKGDGNVYRLGTRLRDTMINGMDVHVPASRIPEADALFAEAVARREASAAAG